MARDTAADLIDDVHAAARPLIDDVVSRVAFMVLVVMLVPVGIVIVAVGFIVMGLTVRVLGYPTGLLGTAIAIGGLLGILAALFFSFRSLYRRMPRRLRAAYAAPTEPARGAPARDPSNARSSGGYGSQDERPRASPAPSLGRAGPGGRGWGLSIDEQVDELVAGGGDLSIRYQQRQSLSLSLVRSHGSALRVLGLIGTSKFLRKPTLPTADIGDRPGPAGDSVSVVRLAALEAAGWKLEAKPARLSRSWATESPEDREHLQRDVARTLSILDDGVGGVRQGRYTSEAEGSVDPIVGVVLGLAGAAVGVITGLILIVVVGPGASSGLALVLGLVAGFVAGVVPGVIGMYMTVEWADRLRGFRGRLANVGLVGGLVPSAASALVVAVVIARL